MTDTNHTSGTLARGRAWRSSRAAGNPARWNAARPVTADAATRLNLDEIAQGLARHAAADWLDDLVPGHDGRMVSIHGQGDRRFRIVTEADRSVTTILLPEATR